MLILKVKVFLSVLLFKSDFWKKWKSTISKKQIQKKWRKEVSKVNFVIEVQRYTALTQNNFKLKKKKIYIKDTGCPRLKGIILCFFAILMNISLETKVDTWQI